MIKSNPVGLGFFIAVFYMLLTDFHSRCVTPRGGR
jgi:hypothetical protein